MFSPLLPLNFHDAILTGCPAQACGSLAATLHCPHPLAFPVLCLRLGCFCLSGLVLCLSSEAQLWLLSFGTFSSNGWQTVQARAGISKNGPVRRSIHL